jgi:hypothetical protein
MKSIVVGGAHWDAPRAAAPPPGPAPELFFAPTHVGRLGAAWGAADFNRKVEAGLADFIADSRRWLHVREAAGLEGARAIWSRLLKGEVGPDEGAIVAL